MFRLLFSAVLFAVLPVAGAGLIFAAEAPLQPIPFSHKKHAGDLKVACKMCHPNPAQGETMTIAPAAKCLDCHSAIKADSPDIQKLAEFAKSGRPVPWVRVYAIPSYVSFSHKAHLDSGNACQDCHGNVIERDRLAKEGDISMGGCMKCHQSKKVSIDCTFCHEQR